MCDHRRVKCMDCGEEGTPAQLLARRPRTRGAASKEQSRTAGRLGGRPRKQEVPA